MITHAVRFAATISLLSLAGCDLDEIGGARETEDFAQSHPMKPGGRLSLENFNGSVEISGWDQEKLEVTGTKHASKRDLLALLRVDVRVTGDAAEIRSIRPTDVPRHGNLGVRYRIKVPRNTRLDRVVSSNGAIGVENVEAVARLRTSNGPVKVTGSKGDADVATSNGPVEIRDFSGSVMVVTSNGPVRAGGVQGRLDVKTSNGPISVDGTDFNRGQAVRLQTSNGPVTLNVAASLDADVHATTSNGPITLRLPSGTGARIKAVTSNSGVTCGLDRLDVTSKTKHSLEATAGGGGPLLALTTSNGPIRIEKR